MAVAAAKKAQQKAPDNTKEDLLRNFKPTEYRGQNITDLIEAENGDHLGRINAFYGETGSAKSSILASYGWLNLKYKDTLEKFGFPKCVKVLQKGILPEIEKMGIVDSDMKWVNDMTSSDWRIKYAPLLDDRVFDISEFALQRKTEYKDGKEIAIYDPGVEDERREFESAAFNYLHDSSFQFVGVDNLSDYIKILEDKAEILYWDNPNAWSGGENEGLKVLNMRLYSKRNSWYFNFMELLRSSKKMSGLVYWTEGNPEFVSKKKAEKGDYDTLYEDPSYKIVWVKGTGLKVDNAYHTVRSYAQGKWFVEHRKGPWVMEPKRIEMPNDPFQFEHLLENAADMLLQEYDPEKFANGEKWW